MPLELPLPSSHSAPLGAPGWLCPTAALEPKLSHRAPPAFLPERPILSLHHDLPMAPGA